MGEIARRARLSKQAMTTMVRLLERDGLVERRLDLHDGRAALVFLTNRAQAFRPVAEATLREPTRITRRRLGAATASTPTLDADWRPVQQGAAIAVMAEETARGMCSQDLTVVPVQPPPGFAVAVAWRRGDRSALLDPFLGFVRGYRDTNAWLADAPRLSPGAQTSIGRLPGRPGFLDLPRA